MPRKLKEKKKVEIKIIIYNVDINAIISAHNNKKNNNDTVHIVSVIFLKSFTESSH